MTKLLEQAMASVRAWPADRQDEAAHLLLALDALGSDRYRASSDELEAIDAALAEVERGERASPAEVENAFRRFRS